MEAPAKRVAVSLGVDDDAGARVETVYRQHVVFGQPITLESGFGMDRLRQRAFADACRQMSAATRRVAGVLVDHSDIQGLSVTRYALGATRLQNRRGGGDSRVQYETRWGFLAAHDHVDIKGSDAYDLPSFTVTGEWLLGMWTISTIPSRVIELRWEGGGGVTLNRGQPYLLSVCALRSGGL